MARFAVVGALVAPFALAASAASADTFTLRIGSGHPYGPSVYVNVASDHFVAEVKRRVEAETDHRVDFVEAYGGTIAGPAETLEAVQSGLLDVGAYCFCFEPAKLFLHNFPYFAPFGPEDSVSAQKAVRKVYDEHPWLSEVFETEYEQKLLGLSGWDNYHLGTSRPWETVADLRGVKVGGAGPNLPWLEFAGAVPVTTTLPEVYMSLRTGVFDGILLFPSSYLGFKLYEPSPYFTLIGFGAMYVNGLTVNLRTFNRLPPEVQEIMIEVGREYEEQSAIALDEQQERGLSGLEEAGATIRELPAEVRAEWARSLADFSNIRAHEANERGMPGTEVMRSYIEAAKELGHEWPVEYRID